MRARADHRILNRKPRYCPVCGHTMCKSGVRMGKQSWACRDRSCRFVTVYPRMSPKKAN